MPPLMRRIFWYLNKFFMVPMFRLGFGPLFGNPFSGYIMVLKVTGRKTGRLRYAPVNYALHAGSVFFISGGRQSSDWYRNILANPLVEAILPGGSVYGRVDEINDPAQRLSVIRAILKNAGFAGFFEGYNPFTISDEQLAMRTADLPLLRLTPTGLAAGASDPGGWAWVWGLGLTLAVIWALIRW